MVRQASPIIAVAAACALFGAVLLGGCGKQPDALYAGSIDAWHAERIERLQAADGWLTLVGLFPLTMGEHTLGSGNEVDLRIEAAAPPIIGTFKVHPDGVSFSAAEGLAVQVTLPIEADADAPDTQPWPLTLGTDREGAPTVLRAGTVSFYVFERDGRTHRLIPIGEPGQPLFIIFHDQTNGLSTYGGGRYLYAEAPNPDGTVILDFNKAYNPPCAFTPYATCPLPPRENALQTSVAAGEKAWPIAW